MFNLARRALGAIVALEIVVLLVLAAWPAPGKYPLGLAGLAIGAGLLIWAFRARRDDISMVLVAVAALLAAAAWTAIGHDWPYVPLVALAAALPLLLFTLLALRASGRADPYDE